MELDITEFFNEARPADYSASVAGLGEHAGEITWNRAVVAARRWNLLDTPDKQAAFRAYIRGFGAWSDAEVKGFSPVELNALLIQLSAAGIREAGLDSGTTWEEYNASENAGRLFQGIDGRVYYDLSE